MKKTLRTLRPIAPSTLASVTAAAAQNQKIQEMTFNLQQIQQTLN